MAGIGECQIPYDKDPRIACRYGAKCYQKNAAHHKKYKHPSKRKEVEACNDPQKEVKKIKLDLKNKEENVFSPVVKHVINKEERESTSVTTENKTKNLNVPDEDDLPSSPENIKDSIKQKFLVEMPDDFYSFWSFCQSKSSEKPEEALKAVGLTLVGPFDLLSGKLHAIKHRKLSLFLIHCRYYYDPPEFQTVIRGDDSKEYHMGYFRDDPQEMPCFVAYNTAAIDCTITPMAENLFGAVNVYLQNMKEKCDPFRKMKVSKLQADLQSWAKEKNFSLEVNSSAMKSRNKKIVSKIFHKAGLVVPVEKNTELGYRELIETEGNLKKILKNIVESVSNDERSAFLSKLQPIVTAANIANDECDFGTSLELGLDLFCYGGDVLHHTALGLLTTAYTLLNRKEFAKIAKAHLKNRRKGPNLSIVD